MFMFETFLIHPRNGTWRPSEFPDWCLIVLGWIECIQRV